MISTVQQLTRFKRVLHTRVIYLIPTKPIHFAHQPSAESARVNKKIKLINLIRATYKKKKTIPAKELYQSGFHDLHQARLQRDNEKLKVTNEL